MLWLFIHPWPSLVGFVILMLALVPFAMFCRRADQRAEMQS